jgi:hypothetical protein
MERPERANTLPVLLIRPVVRTDPVRSADRSGTSALTSTGFALAFGTLFSSQGARPAGPGDAKRPPDTADGRPPDNSR